MCSTSKPSWLAPSTRAETSRAQFQHLLDPDADLPSFPSHESEPEPDFGFASCCNSGKTYSRSHESSFPVTSFRRVSTRMSGPQQPLVSGESSFFVGGNCVPTEHARGAFLRSNTLRGPDSVLISIRCLRKRTCRSDRLYSAKRWRQTTAGSGCRAEHTDAKIHRLHPHHTSLLHTACVHPSKEHLTAQASTDAIDARKTRRCRRRTRRRRACLM